MEISTIAGAVEAVLFVAGDPVETADLAQALEVTDVELAAALSMLENELDYNMRGLKLLRIGSKVQLCTRKEYADYVERVLSPTQKQPLTNTLLETLSVIAYRQPITKADVELVRGVRCDYSVSVLQKLGLICEVGRKETLGRPVLYGTTDEFLRHFAITDLSELPELNLTPPEETEEEFKAPL